MLPRTPQGGTYSKRTPHIGTLVPSSQNFLDCIFCRRLLGLPAVSKCVQLQATACDCVRKRGHRDLFLFLLSLRQC